MAVVWRLFMFVVRASINYWIDDWALPNSAEKELYLDIVDTNKIPDVKVTGSCCQVILLFKGCS